MPARKPSSAPGPKRKLPAATTPEGRESQLVNAAYELAEKQLLDGTASAQVTVHFLKLGTIREQNERKKLDLENKLLEAKTQQIGDSAKQAELLSEAMRVFAGYKGEPMDEEDLDEY